MKKKTMASILVLGLSVLMTNNTYAKKKFDEISLRGSGCPEGTTSIIHSPDGKTISLLFDEMIAEVPNEIGRTHRERLLSRKACNIKLKTLLEEGEKLDSVEVAIDFRGLSSLEDGTKGSFESKLLEWTGPKRHGKKQVFTVADKKWSHQTDEDFMIRNKIRIPIQSQCGKRGDNKVTLVLRNMLTAKIMKAYTNSLPMALMTLDTADITSKMVLKVNTSRCSRYNDHTPPVNDRMLRRKLSCERKGGKWDSLNQRCLRKNRANVTRNRRNRHVRSVN